MRYRFDVDVVVAVLLDVGELHDFCTDPHLVRVRIAPEDFHFFIRERVMSHALGNIEAGFTLKYKNKTLAIASRSGTMHKIYMVGNPQPSYPKLRYSVDLYTSQTSSRRAGVLQKRTPVKITKVYVGPKLVRFLLTTGSGKRGWYQSRTSYIYGRQPILEGTFYAG